MQLQLEAQHFAQHAGQRRQDDHLDRRVEVRVGAQSRDLEGRFQLLEIERKGSDCD